jgi:hypothetical protein
MRFTYDKMATPGKKVVRVATTTDFNEIRPDDYKDGFYINVTDGLNRMGNYIISDDDSYENWRMHLERIAAWKPERTHKEWDPLDPEETDIMKVDAAEVRDHLKMALGDSIKFNSGNNVDPNHYKNYVDAYEWLETMARIPRYRNSPEAFKGAVELQIRKYLDRKGMKGNELEDLQKGLIYYMFLVEYIKNGNQPPSMQEVQRRLK